MQLSTTTLTGPDGALAVVTAPADFYMSEAQEAATEALISLLEKPATAVLVGTTETADPDVFKLTYRAELTRFADDGPALKGARQPSLFSV